MPRDKHANRYNRVNGKARCSYLKRDVVCYKCIKKGRHASNCGKKKH